MRIRNEVYLPSVIGSGYKAFWECKKRYLVNKGSRGSKKSTTAALKIVYNIMKMPQTNALVIRRFDVTHKDSTFAQLKWAINRLEVAHLWKSSLSPMMLTYLPTGQKILFRGLDDAQSITSITVETGYICFVWIEEAFQIAKEEDFDKLDLSIRGDLPDGLYKQFILTFNPWDSHHWLKSRFFDSDDPNVLAMTTNYMCNEFLGQDDIEIFERMKETSPRRYEVEGLGNWGIADGLIYTNWRVENFDWKKMIFDVDDELHPRYLQRFGIDFGFAVDPTAFIACLVDLKNKKIYIFDEMYKAGLSNDQIYQNLAHKGYSKAHIIADSEDPRTINELWLKGLNRIEGAQKGPDSVRAGIQKLQEFELIVHPNCENTIIELSNYCWKKDIAGNKLPKPAEDGYDHLLDALRYATEDITSENFSF